MATKFTFRGVVVTLASVAATGVAGGIISLNVQHYAKGTVFEAILDLLQPAGLWLKMFVTDPRFLIITALLVGGALFLWADGIIRRWTVWRENRRNKRIDRRLAAMTAVLIFGSGFVLSLLWLAIEARGRTPPEVSKSSTAPAPDPKLAEQILNLNRQLDGAIKERDIAQRALASTKKTPAPVDTGSAGPIEWVNNFYWGAVSTGGPEQLMAFVYIRGKNIGSKSVKFKEGTLLSGLTGSTKPLYANIPGGAVPLAQINPVPPGATIDLLVEWKEMLPVKEFLNQWGKLNFKVEYEGGAYDVTYDENFLYEKATLEYPASGLGPRVTKRLDN